MQITRETDYAIRCILHMSRKPEQNFVVSDIASPQLIPKSFLAKILQKFVKAGFVTSSRGARGGFKLAKSPADISLLDVIQLIEGAVAMNMCAIDKKTCSLSDTCTVHPVWIELRKTVENHLKNRSFADLLSKQ